MKASIKHRKVQFAKPRLPKGFEGSFGRLFLQSAACSLSSSLLQSLQQGDWASFFGSSHLTEDLPSFAQEHQCLALLSKCPTLNTAMDTKTTALSSFFACEERCSKTNQSLEGSLLGKSETLPVFHLARLKIGKLLGDGVPPFSKLSLNFGPGATFDVRGDTSSLKKLVSTPTVSFEFSRRMDQLREELPGWAGSLHQVQLVHGSELSFVPKDAKTDRPICIEPTINSMIQRGYGVYLSRLLKKVGVDVSDQSRNRRLAQEGVSRGLTTVDFKSASDLISWKVVLDLLPFDWVVALDECRSHRYFHDGKWITFEKFSSMGNGFTFELESLIFWALGWACCELTHSSLDDLSVYGDDVVIPDAAFPLFQQAATEAGFIVNEKKTFTGSSRFRESCGGDFYDGVDITPFRIKRKLTSYRDLFWLLNSLNRWLWKVSRFGVAIEKYGACQDFILSFIPPQYRFLGPDGLGDGHIIVPWDVGVPPTKVRPKGRFFEGYYIYSLVEEPVIRKVTNTPMSYALYEGTNSANGHQGTPNVYLRRTAGRYESVLIRDTGDRGPGWGYSLRGKSVLRKKRILVRDWAWFSDAGMNSSV